MLTIRVDADACPATIRSHVERMARQYHLELVFYIDDSHELRPAYGQVRQVGQGHDAVDLALVNQVAPGDIVITQDYGLAALVMARRARAVHPGGMLYSEANIDGLLLDRHLAAKSRQAGERSRHPRAWRKTDDLNLVSRLRQMIEENLT